MIHFREPLQKEAEIDTVEYEASSHRQLGENTLTHRNLLLSFSLHPSLSSLSLSSATYVCQILGSALMSVQLNDSLIYYTDTQKLMLFSNSIVISNEFTIILHEEH